LFFDHFLYLSLHLHQRRGVSLERQSLKVKLTELSSLPFYLFQVMARHILPIELAFQYLPQIIQLPLLDLFQSGEPFVG
jgi:hypothetical protein